MIGIIWIQFNWIKDAISERERQFEVHVNDALNAVNEEIDDDEATFLLKTHFGSPDSLVQEFLFHQDDAQLEIKLEEQERGNHKVKEVFVLKNDLRPADSFRTEEIQFSSKSAQQSYSWREKLDEELLSIDSALEKKNVVQHRIARVESIVEDYTFEALLTGNLEDRITAKELKKKLQKALRREGIQSCFAFAVKNKKTNVFEPDFISEKFQKNGANLEFSKELFPDDRRKLMSYELFLQPLGNGDYVWSKVWKMMLLSIGFTLLILFSFGYSIYFILKQKRLSQVKNDFINNMTHELKTPLASISLATASINHPEIIGNPEEVRRLTDIIETEKDRINNHVERVLDTAVLDSGDLKLNFEKVHLKDILERARKNVDLALLNVGGTLEISGGDDVIEADSFHLTNVLTNIFDNSIKYRRDLAPKISVNYFISNQQLTLQIRDNGMGMTSKEQRLAFDTFYRAESGNVHNRKGFGLGLSYVKSAVAKHSGKVTLQSKSGVGSTVQILLPISQQ